MYPSKRCLVLAYSDSLISYWQRQGPCHLERDMLVFPEHKLWRGRCVRCGAADNAAKRTLTSDR